MRSSLLLFALALSSSSAIAVAQDYEPRHGFWMGAGLGFGPASFACDSCDYHRATANKSSQLGGWAISLGLGGTPSPRLRVGAEYSGWLHGLKKNDSLPEIELISLLVVMYARDRGGPFLELGAGFSNYSLVQGPATPSSPSPRLQTPSWVAVGWVSSSASAGSSDPTSRHGSPTRLAEKKRSRLPVEPPSREGGHTMDCFWS